MTIDPDELFTLAPSTNGDGHESDAFERDRWAALYAVADDAIDAGFDVLPAAAWRKPDGTLAKAPLLLHGHLGAHRDRQLIRQQLVMPPHVPGGVPERFQIVAGFVPGSGGGVVADCDVKRDRPGVETLRQLIGEFGVDAFGSVWETPSGGVNVMFTKPPGARYGNASPWPGVDVRADGGWCVAPGCETSVGSWRWVIGGFATAAMLPAAMAVKLSPSNGPAGPAATPAATLAFIEASPSESDPAKWAEFCGRLDELAASTVGARHDGLGGVLAWAFGTYSRPLDLRAVWDAVGAVWATLTPGERREHEPVEWARWIVAQEQPKRDRRSIIANTATTAPPNVDPTTGEIRPGSAMNLPDEFWIERAVLAHIRIAAWSRMVSADALLVNAIPRTATLVPPSFWLPAVIGSSATLDYLAAVIADTSGGKTIAHGVARELIRCPEFDPEDRNPIMMDIPIGSGEGIAEAFMLPEFVRDEKGKLAKSGRQIIGRHALHLVVDEGTAFVNQAQRNGTTVIGTLASAWSGQALGALNASKETRRLIAGGRVRVTAVVNMQAENGHLLFAPQFESVGLTGRIMFASAHDPSAPHDGLPDWPGELTWPTVPAAAQMTGRFAYADEIVAEIRATRHGVLTGRRAIDRRQSQTVLLRCKTAAVLAWWEGRLDVTVDDWRLAGMIAATSGAVLRHLEDVKRSADATSDHLRAEARGVGEAISESAKERRLVAELSARIVERVPPDGVGRMELKRTLTSSTTRHRFDAALDLAVDNGFLVVDDGRITKAST